MLSLSHMPPFCVLCAVNDVSVLLFVGDVGVVGFFFSLVTAPLVAVVTRTVWWVCLSLLSIVLLLGFGPRTVVHTFCALF